MRRFFVKNLLFIITVNVLIKPVWVFFIDRTVQNRLGHEKYGSYPQLLNLALILQIILDLGITNYNNRTIAQQPDKLKTLFPAMLTARLLLMLCYISLSCAIAWVIGYRGYDFVLLLGILFIQIFNTLLLFIRSNISALHKFKADGILSVSDRFLMILIFGFLIIYPATAQHLKLEWFIETQVICYFLTCIAAFLVLRNLVPIKFHFSFDKALVSNIIREGLPYALLIFLMSIYMRADMVMVGRLCGNAGKDEVSIYMSAYRLLDVGNMFGIMFAGVLLPLFARMLIHKDDVYPIIHVSVNMLLPVSFIIAVAAAFWNGPIMQRLYTSATAYDGQVFAWVMACFPAFCLTYVYSTLLTSNGSLKVLTKIAAAGVILNLSLNFYLIPHYHALGAAFAAFITEVFVALCYIYAATKTVKIPFHIKWVLSHLFFLVIVVLFAFAINSVQLNWLFQLGIFGAAGLIAMFVFRFVSFSSIKELFANK